MRLAGPSPDTRRPRRRRPADPVACTGTPSAYAKAVVDSWLPACSLAQDIYNDPQAALGPPDAAGSGPVSYSGFVSLGFGGRVTVDLGGCLNDRPGHDIRVYQAVSSEPVTVYASAVARRPVRAPRGALKACGTPFKGIQGYCEFDLASAGLTQARYVRVEDGELFPCPGGTKTEGADLDAVQALGAATMGVDPERPGPALIHPRLQRPRRVGPASSSPRSRQAAAWPESADSTMRSCRTARAVMPALR